MNKYKKIQLEVYERDGGNCRICGAYTSAPPHHILFKSHGGIDSLLNMILLCGKDHRMVHKDESKWRTELIAMQELIYGPISIDNLKKQGKYSKFKFNK